MAIDNEERSNDLGTSLETARSVAESSATAIKSTAAAGKAVGRAVAGDWIGAAKEVVRDRGLRNFILGVVFVPIACVLLVLYALPSMMFGAIHDFDLKAEDDVISATSGTEYRLDETYNEIPVVAPKVNLMETLKQVLVNFVRSVFTGETTEYNVPINDYSFYVASQENSAINTLIDYTKEEIKLFDKRKEQYSDMLDEIAMDFRKDPPPEAKGYDIFRVMPMMFAPKVTRNEAIQYLTAYSIQRDNGMDNVDTRSLLAWVGYTKQWPSWQTDRYEVEGRQFYTYDWKGDYLPQYQYEQMMTEIRDDLPRTSFDTDSFLEKVYFVDKEDGITVEYIPTEEERYNHLTGEMEIVTVLTMYICMDITLKSSSQISDQVMGFWQDSLNETYDGLHNRYVKGGNPEYLQKTWTANGHEFTRLMGYQDEYMDDHQLTTRQYIGATSYDETEIDFSILGGTQSASQSIEDLMKIVEAELGHVGGFKYSGNHTDEWCAHFIRWCASQAGLSNGGPLSAVSPSCTATWRNYGGKAPGDRYEGGSTDKGTAIVIDDTTIGGGSYIPQRGDLVLFSQRDSSGRLVCGHIGFVYSYDVETDSLITIEGNTGGGGDPSDRRVMCNDRTNGVKYGSSYKGYNIVGFIHPNYPLDQVKPVGQGKQKIDAQFT